jgi:L-threonylcarbamoyladenylate synthase
LGADARNAVAVDRIFAIKRRSAGNPLLVLVPDRDAVCQVAAEVPPVASRLMDRFWPGRVTLVFKAQSRLPQNLTAGTGKIGVRVSGHPVAAALVSKFGKPVTGTSANLSGRPGCDRIGALDPQVAAQVDLILDVGRLTGGQGSTVVDVTGSAPRIIREGAVSRSEIMAALR